MKLLTRATLYGAFLAALWVVLAVVRDGVTFHVAPVLVAVVIPAGMALHEKRPPRLQILRGATVGFALTATAIILLWVLGALEGPALSPFPNAKLETIVFALAGTLAGVAMAYRPDSAT